MTAGDRDFPVPGRLCRPSPSSFKKTAPSPSGPTTDGGEPSVPVLSDPGRTGRLISLNGGTYIINVTYAFDFCGLQKRKSMGLGISAVHTRHATKHQS